MTLGSCDVYQPFAFAMLQVRNLPSSSLDNIDNPYTVLDISLNIIHHCTRNTCQSLHQVTFLNGWIITCLEVYSRPPPGDRAGQEEQQMVIGKERHLVANFLIRITSRSLPYLISWYYNVGPGASNYLIGWCHNVRPGAFNYLIGWSYLGLFWHQWELSITSIRRPR